ncbi:hypothetical protein [Thermomonospora umbrina]|nr:hypothetical protein [Thermomonospora umbrina]
MRRSFRGVAVGGTTVALLVGLGPAQAERLAPTWRDWFPALPADLESRARGAAVDDGRYALTELRPGVYMTTTGRPDRCSVRPEPTARAEAGSVALSAVATGPEPRGPEYFMFEGDTEGGLYAAFVFSGGCTWRWVGGPQDAQRWFSEYTGPR